MKTGLILTLIFLIFATACSKGKFETKPQLKFKSKNTDVVAVNGNLKINIEYTDKEGDVNDSLLVVRERLNKRGPLVLSPSPYKIPVFPNTTKGEFEIDFAYQLGLIFGIPALRIPGSNPAQNEQDTLVLKFVARDAAGNKSDTLTVTNIYVNR